MATVALAALLLTACAGTVPGSPRPIRVDQAERQLVQRYFEALDAAADRGTAEEQDLLRRTQHPDYRDRVCGLAGMTLRMDPAMSSLQPDPRWLASGSGRHPRGVVLRVAVTVTVRRDQADVGQQIGLVHLVLLDGTAYGFAPCPAS
jgi:hypothetical protein